MNHWSVQTDESSGWFFSPRSHKTQGIRCTHQPSPWIGDYGHFAVMANSGRHVHLSAGRRARSYKGTFHPHFVAVDLLNDGTRIEMTPTERGAHFRFKFPDGGGRVLLEPIKGESSVEFHPDGLVTGWVSGNSGSVPQGFAHYFAAQFSLTPTSTTAFQGNEPIHDFMGDRVGFFAEFDKDVEMRIATSFISISQAELNLQRELSSTFEDTLAATEQIWEETLSKIVVESDDTQKLELITAHPDLAGRLALARQLTKESTHEQASAGLDRLSADELARFTALNDSYRGKFGFPFIMAVKGKSKAEIASEFERRIGNDSATEFSTALAQIDRIAALRLAEILP